METAILLSGGVINTVPNAEERLSGMIEKIIKGIKCCMNLEEVCDECPYNHEGDGGENPCLREKLFPDILSLLENQKPVKARSVSRKGAYSQIQHYCGYCNNLLFHRNQKYCANCGRSVKWDA